MEVQGSRRPELELSEQPVQKKKRVVDEHRAEYFIIMAWILWNRCNLVRLNRPAQTLEYIIRAASNFLQDFFKAQEPVQMTRQAGTVHHWCPPPHARFEANFDSTVFQSSNEVGIEMVIRDHRGETIGSLSLCIPLPPTVAEVEALACRRAVLFAKELCLHEVLFEGDLQIVINPLADGRVEPIYGHIIVDILHKAAQLSFSKFVGENFIVRDALIKDDWNWDLISLVFPPSIRSICKPLT
nr:hypothetical protein CFP56_67106 [Quercus suber]